MDTLDSYRDTIERVLSEYATVPYAHGDLRAEVAFDRQHDRYLLLTVGWDRGKRVHASIVHIDIINGKVWVQRDGTEYGVANELVGASIPRDRIVLGFQPEQVRPFTEFAVA